MKITAILLSCVYNSSLNTESREVEEVSTRVDIVEYSSHFLVIDFTERPAPHPV